MGPESGGLRVFEGPFEGPFEGVETGVEREKDRVPKVGRRRRRDDKSFVKFIV